MRNRQIGFFKCVMKHLRLITINVLTCLMIVGVGQIVVKAQERVPTNEEIIKEANDSGIPKEPGTVIIHYRPHNGDNRQFYVYVWDTGTDQNQKFVPMEKKDKEQIAIIKVVEGKDKLNYLITCADNFSGPNDNKVVNDMVAPVNKYTATDVFHNDHDNWYSQFLNVQTKEFDARYGYKDKIVENGKFKVVGDLGQLGATLKADGSATINVWAPTANEVKINLYKSDKKDETDHISLSMTRGTTANYAQHEHNTIGVWTINLAKDQLKDYGYSSMEGVAYDFTLTMPNSYFIQKTEHWVQKPDNTWVKESDKYINSADNSSIKTTADHKSIADFYIGGPKTVTTQDPYSVATVRDGNHSVILDPAKVGKKVTGTKNKRVDSYTKMSVMEIDVRDFSISKSSGVSEENRGNYLGVIQNGTKNPNNNQITGLDYLKYIGINYVQVMPVSDYETVPELLKGDPKNNEISTSFRPDDQQNWGYDPKNYNVPEGSYASDPADPKNRIIELKQMIQGLHDAGINVIMDVVYNHLYAGQKNPFEHTVPGYFYAVNSDGKMNNDVGVGNAIRGDCEMMRRYIVNSTVYWTLEYGMDGFRFDAMSDLDVDTLNEVRKALDSIDEKLVTYGEGWDSMGKYLNNPLNPPGSISNANKLPKYAFFDSVARDSISGSHYDNENPPGFVNNLSEYKNNPAVVCDSLLGGHANKSYLSASQQLNYVEVHDGKTLSDLMYHYNSGDDAKLHKKRVELATAMSTLSQGINFVQIGQEFLKSKEQKHNTYNAGDKHNMIDWDLVKINADAVNLSKSLFKLRQSEPMFQMSDFSKIRKTMVITNAQPKSGIITYELRNEVTGDKYLVVFNNNTATDNNKLTLGNEGNNYYYGADKARGNINGTNDFSKAFIVTSSSPNLYDKIGKYNNEKNITMDYMSATVLFFPAEAKKELKTVKQTINYLDKENKAVHEKSQQAVTYLTVKVTDPKLNFSYQTSGIGTGSQEDLGHLKNVLSHVGTNENETGAPEPVTLKYYATNDKNEYVKVDSEPELDINGKPIDKDGIKWHLVSSKGYVGNKSSDYKNAQLTNNLQEWQAGAVVQSKAVNHPVVKDQEVVNITQGCGDLSKTKALPMLKDEIIDVVYDYKKARAVIISHNDPLNTLPKTIDQAKDSFRQEGKINDLIDFKIKDKDLARQGYSYTVNGQASLVAAIKANNQGRLGQETVTFTVEYRPKEAKIKVIYHDDETDKDIKTDQITGKTGQTVNFKVQDIANYSYVSDNSNEIKEFDDQDDSSEPSQTIVVHLKHRHAQEKLKTKVTVSYQGTANPITKAVREFEWLVDVDLVTNQRRYRPQQVKLVIVSPIIAGYKSDIPEVVVEVSLTTTKPEDQSFTVTYQKSVSNDNQVIIKETTDPKDKKTTAGTKKQASKTGDNKHFEFFILVIAVSLGICLILLRKKQYRQ